LQIGSFLERRMESYARFASVCRVRTSFVSTERLRHTLRLTACPLQSVPSFEIDLKRATILVSSPYHKAFAEVPRPFHPMLSRTKLISALWSVCPNSSRKRPRTPATRSSSRCERTPGTQRPLPAMTRMLSPLPSRHLIVDSCLH
jgi:hypothetical protein